MIVRMSDHVLGNGEGRQQARIVHVPWPLIAGLLLLLFATLPRVALAGCVYDNSNHQPGVVYFNAGTITITLGQDPGPIWTSNTSAVPPGTPLILDCIGYTPSGVVNTIAGQPTGSDSTLFPTGIPGISYRILHPDTSHELKVYPEESINSRRYTRESFSVASNLQLVYTGPYLPSNDSTLSGELARWNVDICSGYFNRHGKCKRGTTSPQAVEIFNLNAIIHIMVPTCDIDPGSINKAVLLSGISRTQLNGQGATGGKTPFTLHLSNCHTNLGVYITLDTNNPQPGTTGVIAPTQGAGYASGVGVQILKADGTTPVTFGDMTLTGTTTDSNYSIDFYARYYQTGTSVSAGDIKATATYLIQYQ